MASVLKNIGLILIIVLHIKYIQPYPADVLIDEMQEEDDGSIDLSRFGDAIFGDPDENVGRMVDEWTPESGTNAEELGNYFEGDILIPFSEARNGLVKESSRWPNNVIPYVFHSSVSSGDRSLIQQAINEYHAKTCLKFVPRSSEKDYISFESSSSGCWSSVGRIGGKQSLNLQSGGCTRIGTIEHEIMHALGFLHEQNRYDRDDFVTVVKQNIKPETLANFEKARYGETTAYDVTYDKGSVMHYSPTAFSRNGQKTIVAKNGSDGQMGQRNGFARSDLMRINAMYKCDSQITGGFPSGNTGQNYVAPSRPQAAKPQGARPQRPGNPAGALISGLGSFFQALGSGAELMGQREGFAESDLIRINRRYCGGQNPGPGGFSGGNGNPSYIDYIDNGISSNYPNYGGFPNYPQGPPHYPQGPPNYPQGPPNYPQRPPNYPQGPPNYPQRPPPPRPQRPPRPFGPIFGLPFIG